MDPASQLDDTCKCGHLLGSPVLKTHLGCIDMIRATARHSVQRASVLIACCSSKWKKPWIN